MALFKTEKKPPRPGTAGRWDVVIGEDMCKACGFCMHVCPVPVFEYRTVPNKLGWFPMYVKHEEHCIGCMLCYQICPDFCIDVAPKDGRASRATAEEPPATSVAR
jgi:2-oxoglutarate ferredoxin oxidoreductase subunit delta